MKKRVAIIGYGFVGKAMHKIFSDALIYDPSFKWSSEKANDGETIKYEDESAPLGCIEVATKGAINERCGLAIVCVPTPPKGMNGEQKVNDDEDSFPSADLSILEETIDWLETELILIKSTIPPGTTDRLREKYGAGGLASICFSPEYIGEGNYYTPPKYPDPIDPRKHDFMILGGDKQDCEDVLSFFTPRLGPAKTYYMIDAVEAELVKYMENTWGATKVTFCNEWYEICKRFGASYPKVREGLLLDSRVEPMHTIVFENKRGFGGKCYPKDLMAIIAQAEEAGYTPELLKEVWESNKRMRKLNNN